MASSRPHGAAATPVTMEQKCPSSVLGAAAAAAAAPAAAPAVAALPSAVAPPAVAVAAAAATAASRSAGTGPTSTSPNLSANSACVPAWLKPPAEVFLGQRHEATHGHAARVLLPLPVLLLPEEAAGAAHRRAALSSPPVSRQRPSGLNASTRTLPWCAVGSAAAAAAAAVEPASAASSAVAGSAVAAAASVEAAAAAAAAAACFFCARALCLWVGAAAGAAGMASGTTSPVLCQFGTVREKYRVWVVVVVSGGKSGSAR